MAEEIESRGRVGARELDDFGGVIRDAPGVGRICFAKNASDRSRSRVQFLVIFLRSRQALLGHSVKNPRRCEERQVKGAFHVSARFRIGIRFFRVGFIHRFDSFDSLLDRQNSEARAPPLRNRKEFLTSSPGACTDSRLAPRLATIWPTRARAS